MQPPADMVLVTGDIVNDGTAAEYAEAVRQLGRMAAPVFPIPGNHDSRPELRQAFPIWRSCRTARFIQYTVEDHPVRIVALDTVVEGALHGALCAGAWLAGRDAVERAGSPDDRHDAPPAGRNRDRPYGRDALSGRRRWPGRDRRTQSPDRAGPVRPSAPADPSQVAGNGGVHHAGHRPPGRLRSAALAFAGAGATTCRPCRSTCGATAWA